MLGSSSQSRYWFRNIYSWIKCSISNPSSGKIELCWALCRDCHWFVDVSVINLFLLSSQVHPSLLSFVILELSPLNISLLPAGTMLNLSLEDAGGILQRKGASRPGSGVFSVCFLVSAVCRGQWYVGHPVALMGGCFPANPLVLLPASQQVLLVLQQATSQQVSVVPQWVAL